MGRPVICQSANLPICQWCERPISPARVRSVVRRIPHGRVATYGDVAAAAGRPRAHRAVGNIMRETRDSSVPCHRVIAAGGKLAATGATCSPSAPCCSQKGSWCRVDASELREEALEKITIEDCR